MAAMWAGETTAREGNLIFAQVISFNNENHSSSTICNTFKETYQRCRFLNIYLQVVGHKGDDAEVRRWPLWGIPILTLSSSRSPRCEIINEKRFHSSDDLQHGSSWQRPPSRHQGFQIILTLFLLLYLTLLCHQKVKTFTTFQTVWKFRHNINVFYCKSTQESWQLIECNYPLWWRGF